eukprot:360328-Chlamydomonas_euryale.AAC.1
MHGERPACKRAKGRLLPARSLVCGAACIALHNLLFVPFVIALPRIWRVPFVIALPRIWRVLGRSPGCSGHRSYLLTSYLLGVLYFPYLTIKMLVFRYDSDALAVACIMAITSAFSWFYVFAARRTVQWARRTYSLGLSGYGAAPWEDSLGVKWLMLGTEGGDDVSKGSDAGVDATELD